MRKIILLSYILLMVFFSVKAAADNAIRFATEATYPPFEYMGEANNIKGFDIDIALVLCKQMKMQCLFSNQDFNSLIPSLEIGKFDAIIAAMGITPERQNQVSFTKSYYEPSASFVAHLQKHYQLNQIFGKTIGVQTSSTFAKYLREKYGNNVTIKGYASIQDAFLDLIAERIDFVLTDTAIAQTWLNENAKNNQFGLAGKPIVNSQYFGLGYGIAVRKNNVELLQRLNQALEEIKASGQYEKIKRQYFGANLK